MSTWTTSERENIPLLNRLGNAFLTTSSPSEPSSNPVFVGGKRARNHTCRLCMCEGHNVHVQCMVYLTDAGGEDKCTECGGFHTLPCRETERAQVIQPVFARYRQRTENWIRKKKEQMEEETTGSETEPEPLQPRQESNLLKITSMYKWVQVEKTLVRNQVANVAILNHLREH
jgi:hypothetical protein